MTLDKYQEWAFYGGTLVFGVFFVLHSVLHVPFNGLNKRPKTGSVLNYVALFFMLLYLVACWTSYGNEGGFLVLTRPDINVLPAIAEVFLLTFASVGFVALVASHMDNSAYFVLVALLSVFAYTFMHVAAAFAQRPHVFDNGAFLLLSVAPLLVYGVMLFLTGPEAWLWKLGAFGFAVLRIVWMIPAAYTTDAWKKQEDMAIAYFWLDVSTVLFFLAFHFLYADTIVSAIVLWLRGRTPKHGKSY